MIARDLIAKGFECLRPREEDVIIRHLIYGETFKAIGSMYGISSNRAQQVKEVAMRKVRLNLLTRHGVEPTSFSKEFFEVRSPKFVCP